MRFLKYSLLMKKFDIFFSRKNYNTSSTNEPQWITIGDNLINDGDFLGSGKIVGLVKLKIITWEWDLQIMYA